MMRYRWIDPNQPPKRERKGPVPMPRARTSRMPGRPLRVPRRGTAVEAPGSEKPPAPEPAETPAARSAPPGVFLAEWHDLDSEQRQQEWRDLVDWVEWLHDRYELSIGGRLPECWPQHPGLIEELRALRAWRDQIYRSDSPSGQAARSWHNDLRGFAAAMTNVYAQGCRARPEHRIPASTEPPTKQAWIDADPTTGIPTRLLTNAWRPHPREGDDVITHEDMRRYLDDGTATALSVGVTEYVHHLDAWWAATEDGWLKITDEAVAGELDTAQTRLAELADAAEVHKRLSGL